MVPPNGEISRVFGDAPAFYAPRRRVFHQTIWNKGHSEITLVGQRPLRVRHIHGFPGISLIFVQLGLFNKKPQECKTLLDRCLYIFKHSEFLSEQPFEIEDGLVEKFLYACEVANFNEKKRITYFEDKMSEIDYRYEMDSERAEGRAEGRAEVAKAMLTKGMDPQIVAECTKLSFEQVEELKKSL